MAEMIRYRSILDPDLKLEEPNTDEGRATLAARVSAAQAENPEDPRYFIGCAEFYDPDAPAPVEPPAVQEATP